MQKQIAAALEAAGGWLPFDAFMHLALYAPQLGYYAGGQQKLGLGPQDGSDFVTAPELSPYFGLTVARQVAEILQATQTDTVWEFGAGSGALAAQIIPALQAAGVALKQYYIVDVSANLRARQQERLAEFGDLVQWVHELPEQMQGVILGNEVLDAMPVKLLARSSGVWHERGVVVATNEEFEAKKALKAVKAAWVATESIVFAYADKPTDLRPPLEPEGEHDYLTEVHAQAEAFVATLAARLQRGAMLFIDYGFGEHEYYHPERSMGTVMCHQQHRADGDALSDVGAKDISAHINFTGIALAAQDVGLDVLGYTSQGRFLLNCGLLDALANASLPERSHALKLVHEHEMGELFKVIALGKDCPADLLGFSSGDRTHTL